VQGGDDIGRHGLVAALCGGILECDPPGRTVRLDALAPELATDFDEEIAHAEPFERAGRLIDAESLRDAAEVDGESARLARAAMLLVDFEALPACACQQPLGSVGIRWMVALRRGPEAPGVGQCPECWIECPVAVSRDRQRCPQNGEEIYRKRMPAPGRRGIEARECRCRNPRAHLTHDVVERVLDGLSGARCVGGRGRVQLCGPCGSHGLAVNMQELVAPRQRVQGIRCRNLRHHDAT